MIDIESLSKVKTIISHQSCPDGTSSAIILHDVIPNAEIKFLKHGSAEHVNLEAVPGMLFCDFSPPESRVQEFVDAQSIVLDHHKSARAVVEAFGDNGVFADEEAEPGVSGAVLAFRHVWKVIKGADQLDKMPYGYYNASQFATLTGIRDTWQTKHESWRESCAQAAVLMFYPWSEWLNVNLFNDGHLLDERMKLGELLLQKKDEDVARTLKETRFFTTTKGTRVLVVNNTSLTSDMAEAMTGPDLLVGFHYRYDPGLQQTQLTLSCRSRSDFDCAAFAKTHGGGGHTKAAGCTLSGMEISADPYTIIEDKVNGFELK